MFANIIPLTLKISHHMSMFDHLPDPEPSRVVVWFSCGVTSAVAAKLAVVEYPQAQLIRITIDSEHEDSDRFSGDVSRWVGLPVKNLKSDRFANQFDVMESTGFIRGPAGAKCTTELKRKIREGFQHGGDLHIFGFDAGEQDRVDDFRENNPNLWFKAPLIDAGLTKSDCKQIVERAGIVLPAMYRLGYDNNNCIGCVKGGAGYWNRIRVDFPLVFARMAALERKIGATVLRYRSGPKIGERMYLDEMDPTMGRFSEDQPGECGPLCQIALEKVGLS